MTYVLGLGSEQFLRSEDVQFEVVLEAGAEHQHRQGVLGRESERKPDVQFREVVVQAPEVVPGL